jgi:hypothetical protein
VALALVVVVQLNEGWAAVAPFEGYAFDGPFQVYDALQRLDAGQRPGRDFPVFHGAGIPLVHYPVYRALGGDLFASELSRQLVTSLGSIVVYLSASWLMVRDLRPGVFWALLTATPGGLALPVRQPFEATADPANSLYGLRSLMPVLFVAVVYRAGPGWGWSAVLGAVQALAWLLGIEQGTALAAAAVVTGVAVPLFRRGSRVTRDITGARLLLAVVVGAAMLVAVLLAVCTPAGLAALFRFYFVNLPADQIWFFGAPPNAFLGDGTAFSRWAASGLTIFAVALAVWWVCEVRAARRAVDAADLRSRLAAAVGAGYGLFSLAAFLGILSGDYQNGALRVAIVLVTIRVWRRVARGPAGRSLRFVLGGLVVALLLAAGWNAARHWSLGRSRRLSDGWRQLTEEFPAVIRSAIPHPATGDLWSTYAGLVEARLGIFHPREDYMIHALGQERAAYAAAFAELRPAFVQTLRRSHSLGFEEWLRTAAWPFYERVLLNYDVAAVSDQTLLWKRTAVPWREPPGEGSSEWATISVTDGEAVVPADPSGSSLAVAVVRVDYEVSNPLRVLPLVSQTPRYLVAAEGSRSAEPVSLPPRAMVHTFPIVPEPGRPFTLRFFVAGPLPGAGLTVKSVAVRYLTIRPENRMFLDG